MQNALSGGFINFLCIPPFCCNCPWTQWTFPILHYIQWVHMGTQIILLVVPAVPSKKTLRLLCCCRMQTAHPRVTLFLALCESVLASFHHFHHVLSFRTLQPHAQPYIKRDHQLCKFCPSTECTAHCWWQYLQSVKILHKIVFEEKHFKISSSQMAAEINSSLTSNLLV